MNPLERPPIAMTPAEHDQLYELALKAVNEGPGTTLLLEEMERAQILPGDRRPADLVGLFDTVEFEYDGFVHRDFRIVYPYMADIEKKNISALSPVGAMLIGLSEGQTIAWRGRDGREHRLTVRKVHPLRPLEPDRALDKDIVELCSTDGFPASDAPGWTLGWSRKHKS